jgi:plastocyanin
MVIQFDPYNQSLASVLLNDGRSIQQQPNVNASYIFDNHRMVIGNNIKNLVVVLPNEAHESTNQARDQYPLANQPYLPQNAVINAGTAVTWFNGDVDHDHRITIVQGNSIPSTEANTSITPKYESGAFKYNTATTAVPFNETGTYTYFEKDVNQDDPAFVMNGTITVINQIQPLTSLSPSSKGNIDTVGMLMVPTQNEQAYVSDLQNRGFAIDSTHNFEDLRGGQSGTGDVQTLIVWTTSGMSLSDIIANLQGFTSGLPYN